MGLFVGVLAVLLSLAAADKDFFFLSLRGACTSQGGNYTCEVTGGSQQTTTLLGGDQGIYFKHTDLDLGEKL